MDSEDLDALLAQYRAEWEEQHATTEEHVGVIPSRRANATYVSTLSTHASLTPCPLGNDLWLYGGEYFDGDKYVPGPSN
ncbi:Kelch repeat-containing protein 3 [Malassezia pachydermatis]